MVMVISRPANECGKNESHADMASFLDDLGDGYSSFQCSSIFFCQWYAYGTEMTDPSSKARLDKVAKNAFDTS